MGRVLLAFGARSRRRSLPVASVLGSPQPHTIVEPALLHRELCHVRTDGYALVDQELELGLPSIAVPVRSRDGRAVAAINVGAQAARVECQTMMRDYVPVLLGRGRSDRCCARAAGDNRTASSVIGLTIPCSWG
jgi:IclR family transcriptional regulator, pca regulon regulatory protein